MPTREPRNKAAGKRPIDVDALWAVKRVGDPTISPDGRLACAAVTTYSSSKDAGAAELWLYPTGFGDRASIAKPRRLAAAGTGTRPCFSPDGRHVAFAAKRDDDAEAQLYVIPVDGGEARRVTTVATGVESIKWFPDGRRIAFVSWVWPDLKGDAAQAARHKEHKGAKVKAHVTERAEYRYWDHWLTDGREPHVFACDVASGRSTDLLAGTGLALRPWDPDVEHYDIAPDSRELALTFDPESEPGMMHRCDIVVVDLATRRTRNLTQKSGRSDEHPR
jgi:dipeptidyl aminopeptidase/acylaminoacyl peptidase